MNKSAAYQAGMTAGMAAAKPSFFGRIASRATEESLMQNRALISDVMDQAVQKSLENTVKNKWKPILGAAVLAGAGIGIGAGIGAAVGSKVRQRTGLPVGSPIYYGPGVQGRFVPYNQAPPMQVSGAPDK